MSAFDFNAITLPVFGGENIEATPRITAGTAFAIGGGFFVTAAHVVTAVIEMDLLLSVGSFLKGDKPGSLGKWGKARVESHELFEDLDLALLRCTSARCEALPWLTEPLEILTTVISGGYPYAHDTENEVLYHRAFSGVISAHRHYPDLGAAPPVYELTFPAPRGLSGAPVLVRGQFFRTPQVVGYVIKNATSGMLVYSDSESVEEENQTTIVERYEFLTYGLAVCSYAVLDVESVILGKSIRQHLTDLDLMRQLPKVPV